MNADGSRSQISTSSTGRSPLAVAVIVNVTVSPEAVPADRLLAAGRRRLCSHERHHGARDLLRVLDLGQVAGVGDDDELGAE